MSVLSFTLVVASITATAAFSAPVFSTPAPQVMVEEYQYSQAELDSLLAPIALYPDTLLTHILISATYPMDVIEADRWRQKNQHLTPEQVTQAVASFEWDTSVKVIVPFTNILHTMADDLTWLQRLGDNVLINEARVLDSIQALRQQAVSYGNVNSTQYINVERQKDIIIITPVHQDVIYVPYYNPHKIYGRWPHAIAPVYWHHKRSYHHQGLFYWSPSVHISTSFYFGGIQWINRHLAIHRGQIKRNYRIKPAKIAYGKSYQRWQHNKQHRRGRYSHRVIHSAPTIYSYQHTKRLQPLHSSNSTHKVLKRQAVVTSAQAPRYTQQASKKKVQNKRQHKQASSSKQQAPLKKGHQPKHKVLRTQNTER